jgi:hypothetical protein
MATNRTRFLRVFSLATVAFTLLLVSGCASREHMNPNYGVRTRAFQAKQRVYSEAAKDNPQGLDSEEAAMIHGNYRKKLSNEKKSEDKASPSRVLILEDNKKSENK